MLGQLQLSRDSDERINSNQRINTGVSTETQLARPMTVEQEQFQAMTPMQGTTRMSSVRLIASQTWQFHQVRGPIRDCSSWDVDEVAGVGYAHAAL
jgi:hypothetical protein